MQLGRRGCLALAGAAAVQPARAQRARDTLVAAFPRPVRTLDGNYENLRENDILGLLTDDALFAVNPADGQAVPLAASGHRLTSPTTLEVDLRDDVRFHDGAALTAEDVVYTYRWLLDPRSLSSYAARFSAWLAGVEATGPRRVVFAMKQPYAMALYDLAMYSKLRRVGTHADTSRPDGINPESQTLRLNGTGPYRVTAFQPGRQITLQRVDGYRAGGPKGSPPIRSIVIRIIPDFATQAAEVVSGGVHWTFEMPAEIAEGAAATGQARIETGPSMRVFYIGLDAAGRTAQGVPLRDVRVRRALNHATDREGIVRNLMKGQGRVLHTACDPVQFGCSEEGVARYAFDPARARALLAEAGQGGGFDLELWAARDRTICEAIVAQWRAVGVRANLRFVQGPTLTQARRENRIGAEWASSGSFGIPDAGALLPDRLGLGSARNFSGDDEMSQEVMAAVSTLDPAQRRRHFSSALQRIADQAYWVPMYTEQQTFLLANDLLYTQAPDGMQRLFTARWR